MTMLVNSFSTRRLRYHRKVTIGKLITLPIFSSFLEVDRVKRIWYLSHMRAAKVQASLRIRAVSPEPSLLAHTSSESRGTFRQKARSLAPLNSWACAVKICNDGMLEDTNSLDGARVWSTHRNSNALILVHTKIAGVFIMAISVWEKGG